MSTWLHNGFEPPPYQFNFFFLFKRRLLSNPQVSNKSPIRTVMVLFAGKYEVLYILYYL